MIYSNLSLVWYLIGSLLGFGGKQFAFDWHVEKFKSRLHHVKLLWIASNLTSNITHQINQVNKSNFS